jgi:hypothetical protein
MTEKADCPGYPSSIQITPIISTSKRNHSLRPAAKMLKKFWLIICIGSFAFGAFLQSDAPHPIDGSDPMIQANAEARNGRLGYLINLKLQSGRLLMDSEAEIDNYIENKHLVAEDDWYVILLNAAGKSIGARPIGNPYRLFPHVSADQEFPLTVKIPLLEGLAAVVIQNQSIQEMIRIPIDHSFKTRAKASRERFLAHDRQNQDRLAQAAKAPKSVANPPPANEPQHFKNLPEKLQRQIEGEMSLEIEKLSRGEKGTMSRPKNSTTEPEAIDGSLRGELEDGMRMTDVHADNQTASDHALAGLRDMNIAAPTADSSFNPADANGSISGRVTRDSDGTGISGVSVYAYNSSWSYVKSVATDSSGNYSVTALAAGSYYLKTQNSAGFVDEYYNDAASQNAATPVAVSAGTNVSNINFGLDTGGSISGKVTRNADGAGISGIYVYAYNSSWSLVKAAAADSSGNYIITGLAAGSYYLKTSNSQGFLDEYYDNMTSQNTATPVAVAIKTSVPNINFGLDTGGSISGRVTRNSDGTGISSVTVAVYNSSWSYVKSGTTDSSGNYNISGLAAGSYYLKTTNSQGFMDEYYDNVTSKNGATLVAVATGTNVPNIGFGLDIGGSISGRVTRDSDGAGISGIYVYLYDSSWISIKSVTTDSSGGYTIAGLATGSYYLKTGNTQGFLNEYYDNVTSQNAATPVVLTTGSNVPNINFGLDVGRIISGKITGDDGAVISAATVLLRLIADTTTSSLYFSASTNSTGAYSLSIPKNILPKEFILSACATGYLRQTVSLTITGNATQNFQLAKGLEMSGTVRDDKGAALSQMRVRAYQDDILVTSTLTKSDGTYSLTLSAGAYDVRVLQVNMNASTAYSPAVVHNISITEPMTRDFTLSPATGILSLKIYCPDQAAASRFNSSSQNRFEFFQSNKTIKAITSSGTQRTQGYDSSAEKYYATFTLYLDNGRYDLVAYLPGCQPISRSSIDISGTTSISLDAPAPFLWTGILRGADNSPLANMNAISYEDTAYASDWTTTDSSGKFTLPLTPNGFVKFYTNEKSSNILHTERIGNIHSGRNSDLVLDAFPSFTDSGSTLIQIYGVPDREKRWNIVMIGDGYTTGSESYTDVNGNGNWDGIVYYDLNKNGVWDSGELYRMYGNASSPVSGKDPTLTNEPFTDLNNDGVPNFNDQGLFDRNTLDTSRSLFGQDLWRQHRDMFNIFRIRVISNQAGHDIRDAAGNTILTRDTALGAYLDTPDRGYLFNADYSLITQYINQYVPECDTRIVVVNQPIRMGRVNSYMFAYGGDYTGLCNDYTVAHELGHNVGGLADEYTEYQETYIGAETSSKNVTALSNPAQLPWRYLLTSGKEIPSIPYSGGIGLYEGAGYYTGGKYRPTQYCMMVSGNRYCPVCTKEIEIRIADLTGIIPSATPQSPAGSADAFSPTFSWADLKGVSHYIFELQKSDNSEAVALFDVYDAGFTLPFALLPTTSYRWRIRPASSGSWGDWSSWVDFTTPEPKVFFNLDLGAGAAELTSTLGVNQTTQPGYAAAIVHSGEAPYGTAVFSFKQGGVTVSEAGVPASPPTTSARVFIDYRSGVSMVPARSDSGVVDVNTGIAAVNYGAATANVAYTLRNTSGNAIATGHGTMEAGKHFSCFISQLKDIASDFNLPDNFQTSIQFGTLDITSDQPLSVLSLRGTMNQKQQFIITTTPVADITQSFGSSPLYFAQIVDGGGYTTSLMLMNTSAATETGTLRIMDNSGADLTVHQAGGSSKASFDYSIPPNGIYRLQTDGSPTNWNVGWVQLIPDSGTSTPVGSGIYGYNPANVLVTESGVPSASATTHARVYVDRSGNHNTGLAIANVSNASADVTIDAYQTDGVTAAGTSLGPLTLAAHGHDSKYADQLIAGLPAEFTGILDIHSTTPFAALTVRSLSNENNDYLLTTFPVADMNRAAPSPIVFPQMADGGGYITQFILLSAGGASSTTIGYFGNDGTPLAVGR